MQTAQKSVLAPTFKIENVLLDFEDRMIGLGTNCIVIDRNSVMILIRASFTMVVISCMKLSARYRESIERLSQSRCREVRIHFEDEVRLFGRSFLLSILIKW